MHRACAGDSGMLERPAGLTRAMVTASGCDDEPSRRAPPASLFGGGGRVAARHGHAGSVRQEFQPCAATTACGSAGIDWSGRAGLGGPVPVRHGWGGRSSLRTGGPLGWPATAYEGCKPDSRPRAERAGALHVEAGGPAARGRPRPPPPRPPGRPHEARRRSRPKIRDSRAPPARVVRRPCGVGRTIWSSLAGWLGE